MAREYVPIFFDWLETTQDLTSEEKGNLIDAVVSYASGQEAENAGFPRNSTVRARLLDACADHGMEKVLRAIDECATHSAASIAYLQAVLSGKPKPDTCQRKPARMVAAHQYSQRSYSGETESVEVVLARMEQCQRPAG